MEKPQRPAPRPRAVAVVVATALAACTATGESQMGSDEVDSYLRARRERLRAAGADFARRMQVPRIERFADGTVIVDRAELVGPIDQEYLRLRVTYLNESATTFDCMRLRFLVVDGRGQPRGEKDVAFVMPLDYRFTPGNSYTDEVHVPTGGAHETPGFDLQVQLAGETW